VDPPLDIKIYDLNIFGFVPITNELKLISINPGHPRANDYNQLYTIIANKIVGFVNDGGQLKIENLIEIYQKLLLSKSHLVQSMAQFFENEYKQLIKPLYFCKHGSL
jgi:hypothetical protein